MTARKNIISIQQAQHHHQQLEIFVGSMPKAISDIIAHIDNNEFVATHLAMIRDRAEELLSTEQARPGENS